MFVRCIFSVFAELSGYSLMKYSSITAIGEILTLSYSASSSRITIFDDETCDSSVDNCKGLGDNSTVETEMVSNFLKQAGVEVLSSSEIHPSSKKVLDALVEVSVREFHALPDEADKIDFLILNRSRILAFSFVVWLMISLSMILFSVGLSTTSSSSLYPPPT